MKRIFIIIAILAGLLFLASCFALPSEDPVLPPPIIRGAEAANYRTVPVFKGDVVAYRDIAANYVSAREETLSFALGDAYIAAVHYDVGDMVQKGDIVAELDRTRIEADIENAEKDASWVRLSLSQLEARHALNLQAAAQTGVPVDEASYLDERQSLQTQLDIIQVRLDYLANENEKRILRAGMDGMVMYALPFQEGDTSTAGQRVMTVADQAQSVFMVRGHDSALLTLGGLYGIKIDGVVYESEVISPETLGISRMAEDEVYLMVVEDDHPQFTDRTYATVHVVLSEVKDALSVASKGIRKANARIFAYVLADGVRTIRDVEIGLEGNASTEILSGLSEGDLVIVD